MTSAAIAPTVAARWVADTSVASAAKTAPNVDIPCPVFGPGWCRAVSCARTQGKHAPRISHRQMISPAAFEGYSIPWATRQSGRPCVQRTSAPSAAATPTNSGSSMGAGEGRGKAHSPNGMARRRLCMSRGVDGFGTREATGRKATGRSCASLQNCPRETTVEWSHYRRLVADCGLSRWDMFTYRVAGEGGRLRSHFGPSSIKPRWRTSIVKPTSSQ